MPEDNVRPHVQLNLRIDLDCGNGDRKIVTDGGSIRNGDKGPVGDKGPDGNPGPDGNKGPDGNPGPDGNKGPDGNPGPDGKQGPAGDPVIVAAGCFDSNGNPSNLHPYFSYNNLRATRLPDERLYHLTFDGYKPLKQFIVKGSSLCSVSDKVPSFLDVVLFDDVLRKLLKASAIKDGTGIVVRVMLADGTPNRWGFAVEISAFGEHSS